MLLQEVRKAANSDQLQDLIDLLPHYKHSAFAIATPNADFNSAEGVGVSFGIVSCLLFCESV